MENPWETGTEYDGHRPAYCSTDDRLSRVQTMTPAELVAAREWPDTQKTVLAKIERRLAAMRVGVYGPLCLSIKQPWAWLIVNGWKNIENRTWPTDLRGRFLVCASKTMTRGDYDACITFVAGWARSLVPQIPEAGLLDRGGIVGEAVILDCVTSHDSEWFTGPYGFVLAEQKPLPFKPMTGRLSFFNERTMR